MTDPQTTTHEVIMFSDSMIKKLQSIADKNVVAAMLLNPENLVYDNMHHITLRDGEALVSYCPAGKEQQYNEDRTWVRSGRQTIKIGRMVRKVLKPSIAIADQTIEDFGKLIQTVYEGDKPYEFRLVKGAAIGKWYSSENYIDQDDCEGGEDCSLWGSCMRYDECQENDYFEIYNKNPERIKMLIQVRKSDESLMSRAIVWLLDNGKHYLDRVYTCDNMHIKEFQQYARDNGWWYKERMSNDDGSVKDSEGQYVDDFVVAKEMVVSGINTDCSYYPYIDTMKWGYIRSADKGFVSKATIAVNHTAPNTYFDCTGGGYSEQSMMCTYDDKVHSRSNCRRLTAGKHSGEWAFYAEVETMHDGKVALNEELQYHSFEKQWYFKEQLVKDTNHYYVFPHEIIKFQRRKYAKQSEEYHYAVKQAALKHGEGKKEKPVLTKRSSAGCSDMVTDLNAMECSLRMREEMPRELPF